MIKNNLYYFHEDFAWLWKYQKNVFCMWTFKHQDTLLSGLKSKNKKTKQNNHILDINTSSCLTMTFLHRFQ